jgi:hypothetical protein
MPWDLSVLPQALRRYEHMFATVSGSRYAAVPTANREETGCDKLAEYCPARTIG